MAIISYPFESVNTGTPSEPVYDRAITAEDERAFNRLRYTNGVFSSVGDSLAVAANGGMAATVGTGGCHIEGALMYNSAPLRLPLEAADASLNRIDRVVARFNTSTSVRAIVIAVKTGATATNPVPPDLVRQPNFYEIALADIYVKKGAASVAASAITDQRLNSALCGFVVAAVPANVDTAGLWGQYQASLDEWLGTVAAAVDGTLAGNLQNQVTGLKTRVEAEESKVQPIAKGGTGATTAAKARGNLGLGNTSGALPVANGGTGATTAGKALASLGALGMEMLWQNASTSSSFAAQTIKLDLSGYGFVHILMKASATAANSVGYALKKGSSQNMEQTGNLSSASASVVLYRNASVAEDGIVFGGGYIKSAASPSADNGRMIPIAVYGIKNVG